MRVYEALCAVLAGLAVVVPAGAQRDAPELDFLEYLGSWQGGDDEWLVIPEWEAEDEDDGDDRDAVEPEEPPGGRKRDDDGDE